MSKNQDNQEFFSVKETAAIFSVSERTVWRWIEEEKVEVCKLGRSVRISMEQIERIKKKGIK